MFKNETEKKVSLAISVALEVFYKKNNFEAKFTHPIYYQNLN